jgi:hypothetical protein
MPASAQSRRAQRRTLRRLNAKEVTNMRHRTLVKTGRIAALQAEALSRHSFTHYTAMVERLSAGYIRPLVRRVPAPKAAK